MDKRIGLEVARKLQRAAFALTELPKDNVIREHAKALGYRYIQITITDVDTGEAAHIYTLRRDEELNQFKSELANLADWPSAFLDELSATVIVGGEQLTDETKTARQLAEKQLLGGRPRQNGIHPDKQREYLHIANWFYKSNLSQREFCREAGISRGTLNRACRYVSENAP